MKNMPKGWTKQRQAACSKAIHNAASELDGATYGAKTFSEDPLNDNIGKLKYAKACVAAALRALGRAAKALEVIK